MNENIMQEKSEPEHLKATTTASKLYYKARM